MRIAHTEGAERIPHPMLTSLMREESADESVGNAREPSPPQSGRTLLRHMGCTHLAQLRLHGDDRLVHQIAFLLRKIRIA